MAQTPNLDKLGDLVATIGSREFGGTFYGIFRDMLAIDECTVFSFPKENAPQRLIIECDSDKGRQTAQRLAGDYVNGGYLTDPNVRRPRSDLMDIYAMDVKDIRDTDYRQHYYEDPALAHELVVLGNAGDTLYYTSFYRKKRNLRFGMGEVGAMSEIGALVIKALHRHSELVTPASDEVPDCIPSTPNEQRAQTLGHLREVLLSGPHRLSQREAEVCAGIVLGYSTLAISLNCAISPNTVATHRKRAYAKLGISSQNELFVRYFSTVRQFQSNATH